MDEKYDNAISGDMGDETSADASGDTVADIEDDTAVDLNLRNEEDIKSITDTSVESSGEDLNAEVAGKIDTELPAETEEALDLNKAGPDEKSDDEIGPLIEQDASKEINPFSTELELLTDKEIDETNSDRTYRPIDEAMDKVSNGEKKLYSELPLEVGATDDREALHRTDIDFLGLDQNEKCNLDTMQEGSPPQLNGESVELHHIGQSMDAPLAELTPEEHRGKGNFSILHNLTKDSEIDRATFDKEKNHYWRVRAQDVIEKEIKKIENDNPDD